MTCRTGVGLFLLLGVIGLVAGPSKLSARDAVQARQTQAPERAETATAAEVTAAIDKLGSFDLSTRTTASRTVRRGAPNVTVPALALAVREHTDGYVRYRALVLLAGFGDAPAAETMRLVLTDRNDRLRTVAYSWFEHHPDRAVLPALIDALAREQSEFVRPALLRALAAFGDDPRARDAIIPLILRGQDDFRGALIDALGDYKATYAVATIADVAKLDGPIQDDAVTALGKIGAESAHAGLAELQRSGPRDVQPSVAAALCLLGSNCASNEDFLKKSLVFGATNDGSQPMLRGASHALAVLAVRNNAGAMTMLLDSGVPAKDPARATIALAIGLVAIRNANLLLTVLEGRKDLDGAAELLRDAFDMLSSEDYELERFYVEVRHEYWAAPANSARRKLTEALIRKLEF
jgi:HEAT repeat protein